MPAYKLNLSDITDEEFEILSQVKVPKTKTGKKRAAADYENWKKSMSAEGIDSSELDFEWEN